MAEDYVEPRPGWRLLSTHGVAVLLIGAALLGVGLWWRYASLVGVAAGLLLAVGLDVLAVARTPRLKARRTVNPPVVHRHGGCIATLDVSGRRPALARITLTDRVGRHDRHVELRTSGLTYRVPTERRGLIEIGPLTITRAGPFGLAVASGVVGAVDHVRVLPQLVPVREMVSGRRRSAVGADESAEHGGTDLVGLHEYVPGDDLRRLHWATSARTGQLMVRDDADPATPHLTVVLDDVAAHYADHGDTETDFEGAVEIAFALCRTAAAQRQPVHLVTVSGAVDVAVSERAGPAELDQQRMYAALADIQPSLAVRHEGKPGGRARGMRLARGLDAVAVVSGAQAPLTELSEIASRGSSGVVLLVDPEDTAATTAGSVHILRGPHATDLARLWDRAVT